MANAVTAKMMELVEALGVAVVDVTLVSSVSEKARQRAVVGGGVCGLLSKNELVGSEVLKLLKDGTSYLQLSSGTSHVLYAPSSTGKTAALLHYMSDFPEPSKAPALMISGQFTGDAEYASFVASTLGIKQKEGVKNSMWWIASLVQGLLPKSGENLQHAPVLILDEFNSLGQDGTNILFAEALARYVYGKRVTVIFVTQNELVAAKLLNINEWRKIGPFPGLTEPDRYAKCPEPTHECKFPPENFRWKNMAWSQSKLSRMIQKRPKYSGRFLEKSDLDEDGNFAWLQGVNNPTSALAIADQRLTRTVPKIEGAFEFEEGFFDD